MKDFYREGLFKLIKGDLKIGEHENNIKLSVIKYGDKMTVDGSEYFDRILEVDIHYNHYYIGTYDLEGKKLKTPKHVGNIEAAQRMVKMVNDYVGRPLYKINPKLLNKFYAFAEEVDPRCELSSSELAEMFLLNNQ